ASEAEHNRLARRRVLSEDLNHAENLVVPGGARVEIGHREGDVMQTIEGLHILILAEPSVLGRGEGYSTMLLDGFNHVAILTSDTARFLEFYREVFDAKVAGS